MSTKSNAKSKPATATEVALSPVAIKAEQGRRRNNKARRKNGEAVVRSKAWYMPHLTNADFTAIKEGETVTKTFNSGRTVTFSLKGDVEAAEAVEA